MNDDDDSVTPIDQDDLIQELEDELDGDGFDFQYREQRIQQLQKE